MRLDESGNPVYYLTDAMGSVIGLADGSGVEVADFRYDSFGNLRSSTGVEGDRELEAGGDFRFQGQWLESTTDLYHFRARYYDPESGRFVSRDPVELIEYEPESSNPYQFVYNNPHIYSDPTGEFTLSDVNASQTIQNILQKQAYNSIRQELIDKAKGVVSDILVSTATTFIQSLVPGTEFTGALNDVLGNNRESQRGGRTWERLLTDTVCDAVFGSYSSQIRDLWIQPIVQPDGTPSFDGFNCGGYTYTLRNRVISTRGRGLPSGPRPDFIIKNGGPAGTDKDPKAYIIGDIKSSWNAVDSKVGSRQWKAITSYAKYSNGHQFIPSALYVTMIGGHESLHRRVVRKGIEKGVYVYFLTLFPNIRR
ncbi:MAG: RHS repeat-associated core domain-containing protein [Cyanobacteria bacterium J06558_2]